METETIDRLFLELSRVTKAKIDLQKEVKVLREALVYVAFTGYVTPLYALPPGITLSGNDTVEVRLNDGRVVVAKHKENK